MGTQVVDLSLPPQNTVLLSFFLAANTRPRSPARISFTLVSWSATALESPPSLSPHVTTLPSAFKAAKADIVLKIPTTLVSWALTALRSPPTSAYPVSAYQVSTVPSVFLAARTYLLRAIKSTPVNWALTVFVNGSQMVTVPSCFLAA